MGKIDFNNMYAIVFEFDHPDPNQSHGSIIFETYLHDSNLKKTQERLKNIGNRYGKAVICKLEAVENIL